MAATKYTYSISQDFPNQKVDSDRLTKEIDESAIVTGLDYINTSGDDCDIWFDDALSGGEETILDTIVANHSGAAIPPSAPDAFNPDTTIFISGEETKKFSTITEALSEAVSGDQVILNSGDYAEDITIPAGVSVVGAYGEGVSIKGDTSNGTRVILNTGSVLRDVTVELPADSSPAISYASSGIAEIKGVSLIGQGNDGVGVEYNHASCTLLVSELTYNSGTCGTLIKASAGKASFSDVMLRSGTLETAVKVATSASLTLAGFQMSPLTSGLTVTDAASVAGGTLRLDDFNIIDSCTNGLHLTADNHDVTIRSGYLKCGSYDLLVDAGISSGSMYSSAVRFRSEKVSVPTEWLTLPSVSLDFQDEFEWGESFTRFWSHSQFGQPRQGAETFFGEGGAYVTGMLVYAENTSNEFTDVTSAAKSPSGSTFTFPGSAVDNAIYLSADLQTESDYIQILGCRFTTTTAKVGGDVILEYWNGSSWAEANGENRSSTSPYTPYAKEYFGRVDAEDVRINLAICQNWTKNDPPTTGTDRYWFRWRVTSTLTTVPIFQRCQVHSNCTLIAEDGFLQMFGRARAIGRLPWDIGMMEAANQSPGNSDVYLSDNLGVGRAENFFVSSALDRIGQVFYVPEDLCTCCPVRVRWSFVGVSGTEGDVVWRVRWALAQNDHGVYFNTSQAPETAPGEQNIEVVSTVSDRRVQYSAVVYLDISEAVGRRNGNPGDLLWITLERDGNDADDTYNNSVAIINLEANYSRWALGGHV